MLTRSAVHWMVSLIVLSVLFVSGCAQKRPVVVDVSSPEATLKTFERARVLKDSKGMFHIMSRSYLLKYYGDNDVKQMQTLNDYVSKLHVTEKDHFEIVSTDSLNGQIVRIMANQYEDEKIIAKNTHFYFVNENGVWKITSAELV